MARFCTLFNMLASESDLKRGYITAQSVMRGVFCLFFPGRGMQPGAGSHDIKLVVLYPAGVFLCIGSRLLACFLSLFPRRLGGFEALRQ